MFSQKKRRYRWVWACVIVLLITIAVFGLFAIWGNLSDGGAEQVNAKKGTETKETEDLNTEKEEKQFYQSYYLVKYDMNVIKVFFSDETGTMTELEDTTIVYETLATQDQRDFEAGIKVDNRDDLNKLIMDYES